MNHNKSDTGLGLAEVADEAPEKSTFKFQHIKPSTRHFAKNKAFEGNTENQPNPRLVGALARREYTGNSALPVDTSNTNIIGTHSRQRVPNPSDRDKVITVENKQVHYHLRYLFLSVVEHHLKSSSRELAFITVNLTKEASDKLRSSSRGPASAYAERLRSRFKKIGGVRDYFFVLEFSKDGSLHAHFIMSYNTADRRELTKWLAKDTNGHSRSVDIKTEYRLYHNARAGMPGWEFLELDDEYGLSNYPHYEHSTQRRYRMEPVNIGSADYLSKDLHRVSVSASGGRNYHAPWHITQLANELYERAYKAQPPE